MLNRTARSLVCCLALATGAAAAPQSAGGWTSQELAKIVASDGEGGDQFGGAVFVDGDTAIVAANQASTSQTGEVYVLALNPGTGDWDEAARLTPNDPSSINEFGVSLALSGDTAVVGAPGPYTTSPGAAYVFDRNQGGAGAWGQVAKLLASDGANFDEFGMAVSISGTTIVVGAILDDHGEYGGSAFGDGSAYVFELVQGVWSEVTKLVASDAQPSFVMLGDRFGEATTVDGDTIVVGAKLYNQGGLTDAGAAYVFERDTQGSGGWSEAAKLVPNDAEPQGRFGRSASLRGDLVAIGAPFQGPEGAAYLFQRAGPSTWTQLAKLVPSAGPALGEFGESVSLWASTLVVGAPSTPASTFGTGAAYVFERHQGGPDAWGEAAALFATDGELGDDFGASVASSAAGVLVGAPGDGVGVSIVGEVQAMAFDPNTGTWFGFDDENDHLITIDPVNGWGTSLALVPSGFDVMGMAFDPNAGVLYACDDTSQLLSLAPSNGSATVIGPLGLFGIRCLAFDPVANVLYGVQTGSKKLVTVDTSTGAATTVSNNSLGFNKLEGLAFDPASNMLLAADKASDQLVSINPATAQATVIGPLGTGKVQGLALDPATNRLLGADGDTDELVDIDPASGATTVVGVFPGTFNIGSVYQFEVTFESQVYCTAGISASGCQASIGASGAASASASAGFVLTASGVEGAKNGQFFYGVNGPQANPWGNGTSLQCVTPPLVRAGLLSAAGTAGFCDGAFSQDLNALWFSNPGKNPGAGTFVQAQLWYRDPANTSNQTTSLSDAVEFYVAP